MVPYPEVVGEVLRQVEGEVVVVVPYPEVVVVDRLQEGEAEGRQEVVVMALRREEVGGKVMLLSCFYAVPSTAPQTGGAGIRLEHSHRLVEISPHWPR